MDRSCHGLFLFVTGFQAPFNCLCCFYPESVPYSTDPAPSPEMSLEALEISSTSRVGQGRRKGQEVAGRCRTGHCTIFLPLLSQFFSKFSFVEKISLITWSLPRPVMSQRGQYSKTSRELQLPSLLNSRSFLVAKVQENNVRPYLSLFSS